jgi:hypothetical protein
LAGLKASKAASSLATGPEVFAGLQLVGAAAAVGFAGGLGPVFARVTGAELRSIRVVAMFGLSGFTRGEASAGRDNAMCR